MAGSEHAAFCLHCREQCHLGILYANLHLGVLSLPARQGTMWRYRHLRCTQLRSHSGNFSKQAGTLRVAILRRCTRLWRDSIWRSERALYSTGRNYLPGAETSSTWKDLARRAVHLHSTASNRHLQVQQAHSPTSMPAHV